MTFGKKLDGVAVALVCGWAALAAAQETPEPVPAPTEESLVGRWVVTIVNGDAVQPDLVMVLELTDDGESFMEVGESREPSGSWEFDSDGTTHHLTQATPDGATVANVLTLPHPDQFTLTSPDGFVLGFQREGTSPPAPVAAAEGTGGEAAAGEGSANERTAAGERPDAEEDEEERDEDEEN